MAVRAKWVPLKELGAHRMHPCHVSRPKFTDTMEITAFAGVGPV